MPSLPTWESTAGDNGARGSQPFFRDVRKARQMPGPEFGYNLLPGLGLFGLSHLLVLVFLAVLTHSRQVRHAPGRAAHRWLVTVPADALGLPFLVPEGPLLLDVCLLFSRGRTVLVAIFSGLPSCPVGPGFPSGLGVAWCISCQRSPDILPCPPLRLA